MPTHIYEQLKVRKLPSAGATSRSENGNTARPVNVVVLVTLSNEISVKSPIRRPSRRSWKLAFEF
ncbi:hypothetical protein L218DRAFT_957749 [Marasmius fiardii PR-910]|nr:hypothetical protein L218DRAFT_957749 [Marasmius fiardii PR-910]